MPGSSYFRKIEEFLREHYEEGENYKDFLKLFCGKKGGGNRSFCIEWTGPPIGRCPRSFPNDSSLPKYHYLPNKETPREGRDPDDWQPKVQLKKEHSSDRLLMSDPESVAAFSNKFVVKAKFVVDYLKHLEVKEFKKKKRAEERARERARKPRKKSMLIMLGKICVKIRPN